MSCPKPAIRLHTPADFAEALPYLLDYRPQQSLVAAVFHHGQLTVAARLDLPALEGGTWFDYAADCARTITTELQDQHLPAPDTIVLYLLSDPAAGQTGRTVATRLAPLAGLLRAAFAHHAVPVQLALCISSNQWWDLTRDTTPGPGTALPDTIPGPTTVAFTVAGMVPAPTQDAITATFAPLTGPAATPLRTALQAAHTTSAPGGPARPGAAHALLERAATAFTDPATTALPSGDTAELLLALSDRLIRDWAMSLPDTHTNGAARRLFTYLATAAVHPYQALACAPLTLLAASAWYDDDQALARLALHRACRLDAEACMPALLLEAFNLPISKQELKDLARSGRTST